MFVKRPDSPFFCTDQTRMLDRRLDFYSKKLDFKLRRKLGKKLPLKCTSVRVQNFDEVFYNQYVEPYHQDNPNKSRSSQLTTTEETLALSKLQLFFSPQRKRLENLTNRTFNWD